MIDARLLALVTAVGFGLAPVLVRMGYERGGTTGTGMILALVASVVLTIAMIPVMDPHWERLTPAAAVAFALGGLSGNAIGRRWSFRSVQLLGASRSTVIRGVSPIFTTLLAMIVFSEVVTPQRWAAILAIVIGAVMVTWTPGGSRRQWLGAGVAYSLGAALAYGIRPIFVKAGLDNVSLPLAAACIGSATALAWTVVREDRAQIRITRLDAAFWIFLVSAIVGAIGQVALIFALSAGDVSYVYPLSSSAPLFAVVFTAILLRGVERIGPGLVIGALLVVAGVALL